MSATLGFIFAYHPIVLALLIFLRFILPVKISLKLKLLFGIYALLTAGRMYLYHFTGGTRFDPRLPRWPQMFFATIYFSSFFITAFIVFREIVNLVYKFMKRSWHAAVISPGSTRVFTAVFLISASLGAGGTLGGFAAPQIVEMEFTLKNLPPEAESYKIAVLADLHVCESTTVEEMQAIVAQVNAKNPDLIVIVGDFQDGSIEQLDHKTSTLAGLKARDGIYAVSGNHEFYSGYQEWISYYEKFNIHFLENTSTVVKSPEGRPLLNLAGIMDRNGKRFGFGGAKIRQAFKHVDENLPVIFLTHRPEYALKAGKKADLVFAGHTHGGCAPLIRELIKAKNQGFVSGLYDHAGNLTVVSNGTRIWAGFCLRLNTPPQIIMATLHPEQQPETKTQQHQNT